MNAADWIVDYLIRQEVTDSFGLPGVVVLELLYAMDRRKEELTPHLTYHEQGAAFAACGYAQATGKLGVAYSTRGPGLTNMITGMADAYYDSLPTMFLTAHNSRDMKKQMRILNNQEMDTVSVVSGFTKYSVRIDRIEDVKREVQKAYTLATTGRKGPVFLDILSSVLKSEIPEGDCPVEMPVETDADKVRVAAEEIAARIQNAKRPVLLIGSGVRQSQTQALVRQIAAKAGIPILSSRTAQDMVPDAREYYGFVGSHATRHSNFIISKSDLMIVLGNRMAFPVNSKSFKPVVEHAATIRIDVDASEYNRDVPNSVPYPFDLQNILPELAKMDLSYSGREEWISVCDELKNKLDQWDRSPVVDKLTQMMQVADPTATFVCDVGNHSFWETNAYAYSKKANRILYSGSFGTLGSALPKAIGAHYSTGKPVVCFTGDQGYQMNIQEMEFISLHNLPITIVILNNVSSGMIREREVKGYNGHFVHTTMDSGYGVPDLEGIAKVYRFDYRRMNALDEWAENSFSYSTRPTLVELIVDENIDLFPYLPVGSVCQDLSPELPRDLFNFLNKL